MADIVNLETGKIWIKCGHVSKGACSVCIRRDLLDRYEKLEAVVEAAKELIEVADLRGDNILPHPADDEKTWTARMQTAWDEIAEALEALDKEERIKTP